MSQKLRTDLHQHTRKGLCWILAFCWFSGLFCGMAVYVSAAETFLSLMRSCVCDAVSVVGLLQIHLIPFLLSAFGFFLGVPVMLYSVCFGKAFLTGIVSLGVMDLFGSAGWLCRGLFLFSSCSVLPVLYLYWIRILRRVTDCTAGISLTLSVLAVILGLCCLDFCIISPYWASLIDL